jgi:hypothetical protein
MAGMISVMILSHGFDVDNRIALFQAERDET